MINSQKLKGFVTVCERESVSPANKICGRYTLCSLAFPEKQNQSLRCTVKQTYTEVKLIFKILNTAMGSY